MKNSVFFFIKRINKSLRVLLYLTVFLFFFFFVAISLTKILGSSSVDLPCERYANKKYELKGSNYT